MTNAPQKKMQKRQKGQDEIQMVEHSAQTTKAPRPLPGPRGLRHVRHPCDDLGVSSEPRDYADDSDSEDETVVPGPAPTGADIARAYTGLNTGLADALKGNTLGKSFSSAAMKPILDKFRVDLGLSKGLSDGFRDAIGASTPAWEPPPSSAPVPPFIIDHLDLDDVRPYSADIAESSERAVELAQLQHEAISQLVELTSKNLERADRTERFTRITTSASLAVAIASLAAAVIAIFR